jgi:hypothetical protein
MSPWLIWTAVSHTARASTVLQILLFLPLTLVTLSRQAFLLLSLLLTIHAIIHGTLLLFWGSSALSVLQVPMHSTLLLVCFNAFSSTVHPLLVTAVEYWASILTSSGPLFIALEGLSSLLVAQKLGQIGKQLVAEGEGYQFGLLIGAAVAYVASAWWIVAVYGAVASFPINASLLGVALTAFCFLTFIGLILRRTNIIESSSLALFIAYNLWLIGFDKSSFSDPASSYAPLLPNLIPHLETLLNFVTNTLPKPVLVALLYRLTILHLASRILPTIGVDNWDSSEGDDDGVWDPRPTGSLTRVLLTYRQFIFITVYSHLLLLDSSQQAWSRWLSVFVTLGIWSVELLVSSDEDDELVTKPWKID